MFRPDGLKPSKLSWKNLFEEGRFIVNAIVFIIREYPSDEYIRQEYPSAAYSRPACLRKQEYLTDEYVRRERGKFYQYYGDTANAPKRLKNFINQWHS